MADARIEARVAELERLTDLDGVREQRAAEGRARREREEAETDRQRRVQDMQRALGLSVEVILDRVERAEGLLRAYNDELEGILSEYVEAARLCHLISGKSVPVSMSHIEVENRFGCRHAAVMGQHRRRLGPLPWASSHYKHTDRWRLRERELLLRHAGPLCPQLIEGD